LPVNVALQLVTPSNGSDVRSITALAPQLRGPAFNKLFVDRAQLLAEPLVTPAPSTMSARLHAA